jgi:small subunit ribosomal protein S17
MPNNRRRLQGMVVSDKMDKTVVVQVATVKRHPLYGKVIRTYEKYMAHDEANQAKEGDTVLIVESRPLSKRKRWALESIVDVGLQLADVKVEAEVEEVLEQQSEAPQADEETVPEAENSDDSE